MKRSFLFLLSIAFVILLVRCDSNISKDSKVDEVKVNESIMDEEYLGVYIGIQNSYYMENKFGDYLIINGNKVSVPGSEYRFLIEDDNKISLQQKSMEDESRYYYEGNFTVFSITDDKIIIEAELIYDEFSSPSYKIEINKETKAVSYTHLTLPTIYSV